MQLSEQSLEKLGNAGLIRDQHYRTGPDAECRCRIDTDDYRKKCPCRTKIISSIPVFQHLLKAAKISWFFSSSFV
jgi:hypothetical protein